MLATVPVERIPLIAAALAVAVRMLWASKPLGADESGFLYVAGQWRPGSALYGDQWVDRPPLLIAIFQVAHQLGEIVSDPAVGLRIVGALAVFATVPTIGAITRIFTGSRMAAAWSAIAAAILLVSPFAGAGEVNGELVAAPFIALGVLGVAIAWDAHGPASARRVIGGAALAGAGLAASILIKQNMIDVGVVAALVTLVLLVQRQLTWTWLWRAAVAGAAGFAATIGVVAAYSIARGTDLGQVFYAMYPFRYDAAEVLATSPSTAAGTRGLILPGFAVLSGLVAIIAVAFFSALRRDATRSRILVVVSLGWAAWTLVSIGLGGNYWRHYLVQLALPAAVAIGVLVSRRSLAVLTAWIAIAAVAGTAVMIASPGARAEEQIGQRVAAMARPGDTIVTVWGDPSVTFASGLSTPYEYLWSLPIKTLDPRLVELNSVLRGSDAPTFFVVRRSVRSWGLETAETAETARILKQRYRLVATLDGARILELKTAAEISAG